MCKSAAGLPLPWCEDQRATSGVSLRGLLFATVQVRLPDPRASGYFPSISLLPRGELGLQVHSTVAIFLSAFSGSELTSS